MLVRRAMEKVTRMWADELAMWELAFLLALPISVAIVVDLNQLLVAMFQGDTLFISLVAVAILCLTRAGVLRAKKFASHHDTRAGQTGQH